MRPAGFEFELSEDWSRWVLQHGLPEMPGPDLAIEESVPVAYWIGPTTAAVLHIRRLVDDSEILTETDIDLFCRIDDDWQTIGSGGGGWADDSPLIRRALPADYVDVHAMNGGSVEDLGCKALWGEVGTDAATAEVLQGGHVTRRPVEAPVGAFVICGTHTEPLTVRVLNVHGDVIAEVEELGGFDV